MSSAAALEPLASRPRLRARRLALRAVRRSVGVAVLLLVWWLFARSAQAGVAIPEPWAVAKQIWHDVRSRGMWYQMKLTVFRGVLGLLLGAAVGIALGFFIARIRIVRAALEPVLSTLYPVPRIVLFPAMVVAIGIGTKSQVTIVAVECMFPLAFTTISGIYGTSQELMRSAANAEAGRLRLAGLLLYGALPSIFAGLRIIVPLMVTIVIAVQMLGGTADGIGYLITVDASRLDPTAVFSLAILSGAFGYLLYRLMVLLTRIVVFWERDLSE